MKKPSKACGVPNCNRSVHARGFCKSHYQKAARTEELPGNKCRVTDCYRLTYAYSPEYCKLHYQQVRPVDEFGVEKCKIENCNKSAKARSFCPAHYAHAKASGEIPGDKCKAASCNICSRAFVTDRQVLS